MSQIAVIGAGITGITTAYALLKRGYSVTVFDRHHYPAMETSFANGGQLSASNAEVWNSWSTVLKGVKWMLDADAPLLLNPLPGWHKYSWMAEFVGAIRNHRANTIETARLAMAARSYLFDWAETERIDFDLERRGILHVYDNARSLEAARKSNTLLTAAGLERFEVEPGEIAGIEPALTGQYAGAFYTPSDSTGDIHKFSVGLARACERLGGKMILGADVTAVTSRNGRHDIRWSGEDAGPASGMMSFDNVVVCAGVASRHFASMLGDRVNVYPVKGYSITVHLDSQESQMHAPWVSLLDDDAKIVTSRLGNDRFRVAGTAEFNGMNRDIRSTRIQPLVDWVRHTFPAVSTERVTPWAGLRPMMPDMMPRVRAGKRPGVFYNTGHGHLGWTLSAATAEMTAGLIEAAALAPENRTARPSALRLSKVN